MKYSWICECCGRNHDTLPMHYGIAAPRNWFGLTEDERTTRAKLSEDICIIDRGEHQGEFYVRGCVDIPVSGSAEPLVFGVWASVSQPSLMHILDRWNVPIEPDEPPRFGWLSTWLNGYPEPHDIRCEIFLRSRNMRPRIVLEPTEYALAVEQHQGITLDRVKQIATDWGHP